MPKWLDKLASAFERKVSAAGSAVVATRVGTAIWTDRDYAKFAEEAYVRNVIANRCIQMIAQSAAFIPLMLVERSKDGKKGREIEDHPLLTLLNRPSPMSTGSELIESIVSYLKLSGNAYIEAVGPQRSGAAPIELYSLRPDRMKVVPGRSAIPMAYEYEANGNVVRWDVDQVNGRSPILHLKQFHPTNDWYGLGNVDPGAFSIDQHNESSSHNMAILQNGAAPSGALMFKPVASEGRLLNAPSSVIEEASKRLTEMHTGARNSGKPFVLGGNVDWVRFGQTLQELQLNESKLDAAREICSAFGVPHILLIPGQSTYNNNREAKLALYEETVLPLFDWLLDHINIWLTPQFSDNIKLVADLDSIDALSVRRDEKRKTFIELFDKKLVTRNEVREGLYYDDAVNRPEFDPTQFEISAITTLMGSGKLSKETGLTQLKAWGILPADLDVQAEIDRIDSEAPAAGGIVDGVDPFAPDLNAPVPPKAKPKVN